MFSWRHMNASDVFHPPGIGKLPAQSDARRGAAPAEPRTPNMHRANDRSHRVRMEAWRLWPLGRGRKNVSNHETRIHLTPTGLLMEGDSISLRFYFASFGVNERNRDYRQSSPPAISQSASSAVSLIVFGPVMFLMYLLAAFSNAASNFGA